MITHNEAQALTSARQDGPLDPIAERELQAHLATCDMCRAFADSVDASTHSLQSLPFLPASPVVRQQVLTKINEPRSAWSRLGSAFASNPAPALSTAAALVIVVALALFVVARLGTPGSPDDTDDQTQFLASETRTAQEIAQDIEADPTEEPDEVQEADEDVEPPDSDEVETTDEGEPTDEPATDEASTLMENDGAEQPSDPASDEPSGDPADAALQEENGVEDDEAAPEPTSAPEEAEEAAEDDMTAAVEEDEADESDEVGTLALPSEDEEATEEPTAEPTEEPTEEPTAEPTEEPTEEPTAEPTEEPTEEPTTVPILPTDDGTAIPEEEEVAEDEDPTPTPEDSPATPAPEESEAPTEEATEEPEVTPTEGSTRIEPIDGAVDDDDDDADSESAEDESPTEPSVGGDNQLAPAATPTPTTVSSEDEESDDEDESPMIVPSDGDADATDDGEDSDRPEPDGSDPNGVEDDPDAAEDDDEVEAGDSGSLSGAEQVSGESPGDGRIYSTDGSVSGIASSDAPGTVSLEEGGIALERTPNGQTVNACVDGECSPISEDGDEAAGSAFPLGWINDNAIYTRFVDGGVDFRSVSLDSNTLEVIDNTLIAQGGEEQQYVSRPFDVNGGLLAPTSVLWIMILPNDVEVVDDNPYGQEMDMLKYEAASETLSYVAQGDLIVAPVSSPGSPSAQFSFDGVDFSVAPNGDQVAVSTGSSIEVYDFSGSLVTTIGEDEDVSVGSVAWTSDGIVFVDQTNGDLRVVQPGE